MLQVFSNLFEELEAEDIIFCNWKSHHSAESHLDGYGDLDLYIPIRFKEKFEAISKANGFRRVASYQSHHNYLEHYFGLDEVTKRFAHIHLYYKIITGEHASKNYNLPLENFIIKNLDRSHLLPKLNISSRRAIFLIRYFIKIGSIYGLLQYWREFKKYKNEWNAYDVSQNFNYEDILEIGISRKELIEIDNIYQGSNFFKQLLSSIKLKKKFKAFRRRNFLKHQLFVIHNLIIRFINRLILKKQKILIPGIVVSICGLDGSGKSSIASSLEENLSKHFCTKLIHLGRPPSTKLTFFFNCFIGMYSFLKKVRGANNKNYLDISKKNVSLIYAIRSVLLAYDRKVQSNNAHKLSTNGYIVICDRYPGLEIGKMDSPRIPADNSKGMLYQFCYMQEQKLYQSIKKAHIIFHLFVPLEVAIDRNNKRNKFGKETIEELKERFLVNAEARFLGKSYHIIDSSVAFESVLTQVIHKIWHSKAWK